MLLGALMYWTSVANGAETFWTSVSMVLLFIAAYILAVGNIRDKRKK